MSLLNKGIIHGGKKMAYTTIKSIDQSMEQGFSTSSHIAVTEPVKPKTSAINFHEINTEKKAEEIKNKTDKKIARITELMDNYVRSMQKDIKIQVNNNTGDISVKVISQETGKIIREIPSQEMLELAARIEEVSGIFFDQKV
jgi:flagellar protein FlaG